MKSWWKLLVGIGLVMFVLAHHKPAQCQEYLVATLASYHFDRNRGYNENNLGLGYERRVSENWSLAVGFYENSFYRTSAYALGAYTPWTIAGWRMGALVGGVSGYDEGRVSLWLTGVVTKDWGRFGLNVVAAPTAIALQAKWRLE